MLERVHSATARRTQYQHLSLSPVIRRNACASSNARLARPRGRAAADACRARATMPFCCSCLCVQRPCEWGGRKRKQYVKALPVAADKRFVSCATETADLRTADAITQTDPVRRAAHRCAG